MADLQSRFDQGGGRRPVRGGEPARHRANYRTKDAERWAAHYGVAYVEPDFDAIDWRSAALWALAALEASGRPDAVLALLRRTFADGRPASSSEDLRSVGRDLGLDVERVERMVATGSADDVHGRAVARALAQGAFGVPTFVVEDGELFWGQDRLPLLVDHIRLVAGRRSQGVTDEH